MSQVKPRGSPRFRYNPITVTGPVLVLLLLSPALPASASDAAPRQAPGQAAPAAAPDFDQLLARAMELHKGGDLLGAIETYKEALALVPDRADALSNLGAAYARLGQYDDAVKQYDAALKSDPSNTQIRMNLALAYYKSARPAEAIPQLKRVLSSDPDARAAYLVLAECYLQTGQHKEAASLLQPREPMFETDLAFAYLLGTALLDGGDAAAGQRYVDRVFAAGESAEGHLLMGVAYLAQYDYRSAKPELENAIRMNPRLPTAHALYGRALLALGEQSAAENEFRRELANNINDFEANLHLGNIRKSTQRFDEASAYLERAVSIRPRDVTARRLLASLRLQTDRIDEAVTMLEAIEKEAPDLVDVHVQLATAYNRLQRSEDAARQKSIVDRLNAEAAAKQKGKGGGPDNSQLPNSQLPIDSQLPTPKTARFRVVQYGRWASCLGGFGSWSLGVDWALGVAELGVDT